MKSISTFGETQGDMVPLITELVTISDYLVAFAGVKYHNKPLQLHAGYCNPRPSPEKRASR
jgi:hypothetical protein